MLFIPACCTVRILKESWGVVCCCLRYELPDKLCGRVHHGCDAAADAVMRRAGDFSIKRTIKSLARPLIPGPSLKLPRKICLYSSTSDLALKGRQPVSTI